MILTTTDNSSKLVTVGTSTTKGNCQNKSFVTQDNNCCRDILLELFDYMDLEVRPWWAFHHVMSALKLWQRHVMLAGAMSGSFVCICVLYRISLSAVVRLKNHLQQAHKRKWGQLNTLAAVPFVVLSASVFCTGSACQRFFHFFFSLVFIEVIP